MTSKTWITVGALLGCMVVAAPAGARELKIGVVNMQRAVSETTEGQKAESDLMRLKKKLEDELNRKLKEFYEEQAKLQKAMAILKPEEKRKRVAESQKQFQALQKRYMEAERDLMKRKASAMRKISAKLGTVIEKIARRDKYDYIFANAAVLWAPRHTDLTNEVIRIYNK